MKKQTTKDLIQLNLTQKQMDLLVKIFHLGKWMIDSNENHPRIKFPEEHKLEQFILSHVYNDTVCFSEESKEFQLEENLQWEYYEFTKKYDEQIFIEDLVIKLARRDVKKENGIDYPYMSVKEKLEGELKYGLKYEEEFEKNGLENLIVEGLFETDK